MVQLSGPFADKSALSGWGGETQVLRLQFRRIICDVILWVVERGVKARAVVHAYLGQCVEVEGKITVVVDLKHRYAKAPLVSMAAYV